MTQLARFQAALAASEADGAILSSDLNRRYLSGFDYTDGYLLVTPTEALLLADFRYIEAARAQVTGFDVILPTATMTEEIKIQITNRRLRRLLIEEAELSYAEFGRLSAALSDVSLCAGASDLLNKQRMVKTPEELEKIAKAQVLTDAAFAHILPLLSPRMTEREVALELEFFMRRNGADGVAFDTIAVSGAASALPHGVPSDTPLRQGFLTMDFGAKLDGYCSDMTRTVVIGKADEEMKRVYNTVLAAQAAALDGLREGLGCREADALARRIIREAGFGACFGHSLGHGVGLYIHEAPNLSPRAAESAVLTKGNVVSVEPGIYLEGQYGCRIEDMVAIDYDGCLLNFTHSPKELMEI